MPEIIRDKQALLNAISATCEGKEKPCIVCLYGGPASGKTTLANGIQKNFPNTAVMGTDDFALGTRAYRHAHLEGKVSPPEKYDRALMNAIIEKLKTMETGGTVRLPRYSEQTGEAVCVGYENFPVVINNKPDLIVVEGDFHFLDDANKADMIIFVDVPDEVRLQRRIDRDTKYRNASEDDVRKSFATRQEAQFLPYTLPLKDIADVIVEF